MIMGVRHDKCKQLQANSYVLHGIEADIAQLARAMYRSERKGVKKNIKQIIKKLDKLLLKV